MPSKPWALALLVVGVLGGCRSDNGASTNLSSSDLVRSQARHVDVNLSSPDASGNFATTTRHLGVYRINYYGTEAFNLGFAYEAGYQSSGDWAFKLVRQTSPSVESSDSGSALWRFDSGKLAEKAAQYEGVSSKLYTAKVQQRIDGDGAEVAYTALDGALYNRTESVALSGGIPSSKTLTYQITQAGASLSVGQKLFQETRSYAADPFTSGGWYTSDIKYYDGSTNGQSELVGQVTYSRTRTVSGTTTTDVTQTTCLDGAGSEAHFSTTVSQVPKTVSCPLSGTYSSQTETVVADSAALRETTTLLQTDGATSTTDKEVTLRTFADWAQQRLSEKTVTVYTGNGASATSIRTYTYDDHGQVVSDIYQVQADGTGFKETTSYAANGVESEVNHWSDPLGNTKDRQTLYTQDEAGRIASKTPWNISGAASTCTGQTKVTYAYAETDEGGMEKTETSYACQAGGTAYETAPSSKTVTTFNSLGQTTWNLSYTYTGGAFVLTGQTAHQYGTAHELERTQHYSVTSGVATATYQTQYVYDKNLFLSYSVDIGKDNSQCLRVDTTTGSCTTLCSPGVSCFTKTTYSY